MYNTQVFNRVILPSKNIVFNNYAKFTDYIIDLPCNILINKIDIQIDNLFQTFNPALFSLYKNYVNGSNYKKARQEDTFIVSRHVKCANSLI